MKKICIVATIPFALNVFMRPHIVMLAEQHQLTLVANGSALEVNSMLGENVGFVNVNFARKISIWLDLLALVQLYKLFRIERFDVVHSLMPKTALLAMMAAFLAGVPNRIHTFTGQVWANKRGVARGVLKFFDKVIAFFATQLLTDSFTQRQFLIEQNVVNENKISVLGNGSVCGVNVSRFKPSLTMRNAMRTKLGIPDNAIVYLYLGRLNKDKGIQDLAQAFKSIANVNPLVHLLVVGPDEGGMDATLASILYKYSNQYHRVGFTDTPEDFMACADIFCMPSYREGFGSVIIEAAAAGVPSVASKIYGLVDAVKEAETGILHRPKDIKGITEALLKLTTDFQLREKMSKQALLRAHNLFAEAIVVKEMRIFYQKLFNESF